MPLPIYYRFLCVFRCDEGAFQLKTMSIQIATCNCCLVLFNPVWELTNKLDICTILYLYWDTHWHNVHYRYCYICLSPFWNRNNVMYHGICEFVLWKENVVIAFQKLQDCNILKSPATASNLRAKKNVHKVESTSESTAPLQILSDHFWKIKLCNYFSL